MSSTSLNESLACIALGYISSTREHSLDGFHDLITKSTGTSGLWSKVVARCEIPDKTISSYRNNYKDVGNIPNPWIYTSYTTAITVQNTLKLTDTDLDEYIFSKVEKNLKYKSFFLKQKATLAIKKYSKAKLGNKAGILATLNADKVNIADIFIVKKKSSIYDNIEQLIKNTDVSASVLKTNMLENKDMLTMTSYLNLMIEGWKAKEIYSVSLKALDNKQKSVPVKVHNLPFGLSKSFEQIEQDEFAVYLSYLVSVASSSGNTYQPFLDAIDDFVSIKPVVFTAQDRLNVYFDFIYNANTRDKVVRKYHIFTNFGSGNAIHFVPEGSKSASGEGGITINYFYTLVKQFPELKQFFKELSKIRLDIFESACKAYGVSPNGILEKLGQRSLTSGVFNSSFYLASDYAKLIDKMLETDNIFKVGQVIKRNNQYYAKINDKEEKLDESGNVVMNAKGKPVMIQVMEEKLIINPTNLLVLKKFFDDYTSHLSKTPGSMGKFLGISENSKALMRKKYVSIQNDIDKLMAKNKKNPNLKDTEKKQGIRKILDDVKYSIPTYKKSYALLTNAEFGYMFAKYQQDIEEVLKKQVLLSFYAAASGRGYIIFDGKRFSASDYYEKSVSPPPFLKVGV